MSDGSTSPARDGTPRSFPYLSASSAQRIGDLVALRLAPACAASAIAYTRVDSEWQTLLVFASMLIAYTALRRPQYPMHLIPVASATLYILAPLLGAALAVAISATDGYAVSDVNAHEMVPTVLGAWIVTGLGGWLTHTLRRDREVRVAVIGSHEFARGLEVELDAVGVRGYRVVGCIDPEVSCPTDVVAGVKCLGSLVLLRQTVLHNGIELLVLGPLSPTTQMEEVDSANGAFSGSGISRLEAFERVADACLDLPVSMIEAGQLYEELFGHVPLGTTTAAWFQYLLHPRYKARWPASKRALDLSAGLAASFFALPIVALAALAIKISDPRAPILHRQPRMGEGGRDIELLKLRTMRVHDGAQVWTAEEDERVTGVGRILRRLHIDELPQLWLVLKGQMSLVGPRPEQPEIVGVLETRFSYYDRRHLVKPGITGWAQVRCGYGGSEIGSAWKLCHDLYYLKRRSVFFDLLIMLETLSTILVAEPISRPDERFIVAARAGEEIEATLESA